MNNFNPSKEWYEKYADSESNYKDVNAGTLECKNFEQAYNEAMKVLDDLITKREKDIQYYEDKHDTESHDFYVAFKQGLTTAKKTIQMNIDIRLKRGFFEAKTSNVG